MSKKNISTVVPFGLNHPTRTYSIIVNRHGDKDGDTLTADGERQIATVAERLAGRNVIGIGFSGRYRTGQTARIFADVLNINNPPAIIPGLDFKYVMAASGTTKADFEYLEPKAFARAVKDGRPENIGDWEKLMPRYVIAARAQLTGVLVSLAGLMLRNDKQDGAVFIGASHSPMAEMAVTDQEFPRLAVSAGVEYVVKMENGTAEIIDSIYLPPADDSCTTSAMANKDPNE